MKRYRTYALVGKRTYPRALGEIVDYMDSPILHIGENIGNFTDFVNNIYKVCELQGYYSLISSHVYENFNFSGRDIKISEKIEIVPHMRTNHHHIFQIVAQELYSTYCGDDNRCNELHMDYTGCIMHESVVTSGSSIRTVTGYYLVVNTVDESIKVMTDTASKSCLP